MKTVWLERAPDVFQFHCGTDSWELVRNRALASCLLRRIVFQLAIESRFANSQEPGRLQLVAIEFSDGPQDGLFFKLSDGNDLRVPVLFPLPLADSGTGKFATSRGRSFEWINGPVVKA